MSKTHQHGSHGGHGGHGHGHARAGHHGYLLALVLTVGYALVEVAGGMWTGSLALLSDAGHMFSDALALGLAAVAARLAQRPASARHSYGWARAEVIGALVNGLSMLAIVIWLVVESVERLLDPQPVEALGLIVISFIGMIVNVVVMYVLSHGEKSLNRRAALLHVMGDLVSSLAALIAGAVIHFTGWLAIDPILSLVIGMLILLSTLNLLRETVHVLMEGVPHAIELQTIGAALATVPGVGRVHDLHVWSISSSRTALSAHLEIVKLDDWPAVLHATRQLLHERFDINHVTLQPEIHQPEGHHAPVKVWRRRPEH